ncbi:MAG: prolipoprotein diacylglyceryl transferase family protein [Bacteroidota bacterium]
MYPDLSYLFHDLFGTEPDNWTSIFKMFGVMLMFAFLTAAFFFRLELKRMAGLGIYQPTKVKMVYGQPAKTGELLSNAIFGFILGFKGYYIFQHFAEFQKDPASVLLSAKGDWLIGILLAAVFAGLMYWEKKRNALKKIKTEIVDVYPHDRIADLTMMAAVGGILGAKIFAILEEPTGFLDDPIGTFFSGSGLAIYGGLIGGYLAVTWYMRKHKIPFWPTADAVAPALIFAYGVGRIGCQLSGDGDWGIMAAAQPEWWFLPDWMWSYDYPNNVNNANTADGFRAVAGGLVEGCNEEVFNSSRTYPIEDRCAEACGIRYCHYIPEKVYPTPFYETIMSFLIGGFLWAIRKKNLIPGMIFFIYLMLNGIERFFIEKIRVNVKYEFLPFQPTQAEVISLLLFIVGVAGIIWLRKKHRKE